MPSSRIKTFPGAVRASDLSNKSEYKTPGVLFHAAFDFDAPRPQNTQKPDLKKTRFSKNDEVLV